jgi:hypothetical protein
VFLEKPEFLSKIGKAEITRTTKTTPAKPFLEKNKFIKAELVIKK